MKKTFKAHLLFNLEHNEFDMWGFEPYSKDKYLVLGCKEIEFDIPDGFDPRPAQIEALKAQEKAAAAAFHTMQVDIQRQISQLTALEVA